MSTSRTFVRFPNWLGDIVMALPAWQALRAWPDAGTLTIAVPAPFASLARLVDGADEVLPLASSGTSWGRAFAEDVARVRAGGFTRALLLTNSFGSAWMARRAGIAERWGYAADARRVLLTRAVTRRYRTTGDTSRHHSRYYVRLLDALGIGIAPAEDGAARLRVDDDARARAAAVLVPEDVADARVLIGVAPGAAFGTAKRWPPDFVARAVLDLAGDGRAAFLLLGADADRASGIAIESALSRAAAAGRVPRVVNLIGRTDLVALAGVLARCDVVLANDSGAMHVATAVGTPVVVPFGPTDADATSPLGPHMILTAPVFCRPCHLRTCPIDHRCMRRIPPEQVVAAVETLLARRGERA